MPRLLSVALTQPAVEARTKTETRRLGWWDAATGTPRVHPGERLTLCRKVMGRRRGEPLERIVDVRLTAVRREPLQAITDAGVAAEGFPHWTRTQFIDFWNDHMGGTGLTPVTVLAWEYRRDLAFDYGDGKHWSVSAPGGTDWCSDCRADGTMRAALHRHYVRGRSRR